MKERLPVTAEHALRPAGPAAVIRRHLPPKLQAKLQRRPPKSTRKSSQPRQWPPG